MNKSFTNFVKLLKIAALLPKADVQLAKRYKLTRKQMYLIYLIQEGGANFQNLKAYADLLNISTSTLTRNIEKLEARKVLERNYAEHRKNVTLKLLSQGQLYALDIAQHMDRQFAGLKLGRIIDGIL